MRSWPQQRGFPCDSEKSNPAQQRMCSIRSTAGKAEFGLRIAKRRPIAPSPWSSPLTRGGAHWLAGPALGPWPPTRQSPVSSSSRSPPQPDVLRREDSSAVLISCSGKSWCKADRVRDGGREGHMGVLRCCEDEDREVPPYLADSSLRRRSGSLVRFVRGPSRGVLIRDAKNGLGISRVLDGRSW